jgi:hypothetical protein
MQTSNDETAHTNRATTRNVPAVLNSDGEGARTVIDYGGSEDALMSNVTTTTKMRTHVDQQKNRTRPQVKKRTQVKAAPRRAERK